MGRGRAQEGLRLKPERSARPDCAEIKQESIRKLLPAASLALLAEAARPDAVATGNDPWRSPRSRTTSARGPAAAAAAAARGRALAGVRAAGADPGPARPVHRLPVRARHPAVGDELARRRTRRVRRPRQLLQDLERLDLPHRPSGTRSSTRPSPPSSSWRSGCGSRCCSTAISRGKAFTRAFILLPFIIPTVLSTFAWKWMFDPDLQRAQLAALHARPDHRPHQLAGRSRPGDALDHHRQHLARRAVLRHQPAGRAADHQPRAQRGRGHRRRQAAGSASGTSPGRCCCR